MVFLYRFFYPNIFDRNNFLRFHEYMWFCWLSRNNFHDNVFIQIYLHLNLINRVDLQFFVEPIDNCVITNFMENNFFYFLNQTIGKLDDLINNEK